MSDAPAPTSAANTLMVCVTCRRPMPDMPEGYDQPGKGLAETLRQRLADDEALTVKAVECLSVCRRPCTVALAAPGKWTYVVADLDRDGNLDDIVTAARLYAATGDGIIPWKERPLSFRKGVVARVPPLPTESHS